MRVRARVSEHSLLFFKVCVERRQVIVCIEKQVSVAGDEGDSHLGWGHIDTLAICRVKAVACAKGVLTLDISGQLAFSGFFPNGAFARATMFIKNEGRVACQIASCVSILLVAFYVNPRLTVTVAFFQIEDVTITMVGNAAGVCGGLVFGIIKPELARFRVWLTLRNTDAVLDVVGFVRPEVLVARTEVVGTNVGIIHAFEAAIGIAEGAEVGTG